MFVCGGWGLVRAMGQAFWIQLSRGWEEDCEGYGSPEEAPDLALGRMQSEGFLEEVVGSGRAQRGKGLDRDQDKR